MLLPGMCTSSIFNTQYVPLRRSRVAKRAQHVVHNGETGVILFVLFCTFLVGSLKSTTPIFLEMFLSPCFTVLVEYL